MSHTARLLAVVHREAGADRCRRTLEEALAAGQLSLLSNITRDAAAHL
jgi:hypothetical protein